MSASTVTAWTTWSSWSPCGCERSACCRAPSLPAIARGSLDAAAARCGQRQTYQADTGAFVSYPIYNRGHLLASNQIVGPAIVEEPSSTTLIHSGDVLTVGDHGELVIECR